MQVTATVIRYLMTFLFDLLCDVSLMCCDAFESHRKGRIHCSYIKKECMHQILGVIDVLLIDIGGGFSSVLFVPFYLIGWESVCMVNSRFVFLGMLVLGDILIGVSRNG